MASVVIEKVAEVAPAVTVTTAGTVAADVLLEFSVTKIPPDGATPLSVTVPVEAVPPVTVVGYSDTPITAGAEMVSDAALDEVPNAAVIVAIVDVDTGLELIANAAEVEPAGTVTVVGTVAAAEFELKAIAYPPLGAGPPIVTVPEEDAPPMTLVGLTETALIFGVFIVNAMELTAPP